MMRDYWFKPKTHGYGAAPANWKGWLSIPAFMLAVFATLWPWLLSPALAGEEPTAAGLIATFVIGTAVTLGFIWLCRVKTDGAWAWRWGQPPPGSGR